MSVNFGCSCGCVCDFLVVSVGVQLGSCSVLKLGVDRNVGLDKEGLVVVMWVWVWGWVRRRI